MVSSWTQARLYVDVTLNSRGSFTNCLGDSRTRLPVATKCRRAQESRRGGVEITTRGQNEGGMDQEDSPW
jgi:hypothetical protein